MLLDLYLLDKYYGESGSVMYEEDLVERYGRDSVNSALQSGYLDHGYIPCGQGQRRCVCRLSEKGAFYARNFE